MYQAKQTQSTATASFAEQRLAQFYKAAGDSTRLEILRVLHNDSFGVQELASIFTMAQPAMSHHLKVMATAGLIDSQRQGNSIFYRRTLIKGVGQLQRMKSSLYHEVDTLEVPATLKKKIQDIYTARSKRSLSFFEKNAHQFKEQQGLLCELKEYVSNMRELLDLAQLRKTSRVLEVGPGHGEFLKELSGRYTNLVALDSSEKILAAARQQMSDTAAKITFVCKALEDYKLPASAKRFDALILNMVLHHIPSPQNAFQKAAELTTDKGYILLADLAPHDQDWVKESCGDLWLGFEPDELTLWAEQAGFSAKQSLYLGLKNGFQVQLKLFQKCHLKES